MKKRIGTLSAILAVATAAVLLNVLPSHNVQVVKAQQLSQEQVQAAIDAAMPGIVCWGDSITKGSLGMGVTYPDTVYQLMDANLIQPIRQKTGYAGLVTPRVVNMGVPSENSCEIAGRQGGLPFVITKSFVIPATGLSEEIHYASPYKLNTTKILLEERTEENPVTINGVTGILVRKFDVQEDHSRYYFQRLQQGTPVTVPVGAQMITNSATKYASYIPIMMMGSNGGWDNADDLVTQYQMMINHMTGDPSKYLIIGMMKNYDTNLPKIQKEEATLQRAFGKRYMSARKELNTRGLKLAGITPTVTDQKRIKEGQIPASLLSDEDLLHYNAQGYATFGVIVYQKLDSLGYFDGLKALAK